MSKIEIFESIPDEFGISPKELIALLSKRLELKKKNKETEDISIE